MRTICQHRLLRKKQLPQLPVDNIDSQRSRIVRLQSTVHDGVHKWMHKISLVFIQGKSAQVSDPPPATAKLQRPLTHFPLLHLPSELLFEILGHLDPISLICLSLTNHQFRLIIPVPQASLSQCARWIISFRLYHDRTTLRNPLPRNSTCMLRKDMEHCWICKSTRLRGWLAFRNSIQRARARFHKKTPSKSIINLTCRHCDTILPTHIDFGGERHCSGCIQTCEHCGYPNSRLLCYARWKMHHEETMHAIQSEQAELF
ncbi:hypothetical protein N7G274_009114 [Stereocaulon virgatum]|uniref:F-box domain-containing protein n=1 Tax=Stereocaulon virgatum TaxID=373712 RepID=A0ABR3ZZN7_9LECA